MRTGGRKAALFTLVMAAGLIISSSALAGPITGRYASDDMSGPVNIGRWSEGYSDPLNPFSAGNIAHAQDWNGLLLGSMWEFNGAITGSPVFIVGDENTVSGEVWISRTFDVSGATLTLKDTGAWWNAADSGSEYVFNVDSYSQLLILTLSNGQLIEGTSTDRFSATWDQNSNYQIIGGHIAGGLDGMGVLPSDFPAYEPGSATLGSFGTGALVRFTIIPEPATMGLLALGLGGLLARRRRAIK